MDAAVMVMGCFKAAGVNVYDCLVYFLRHIHEYDNDYTRDQAELLPGNLLAKSLVKPVGDLIPTSYTTSDHPSG